MRYPLGIPGVIEEKTKNLGQGRRSPARVLNHAPLEYKAIMLTTMKMSLNSKFKTES
jgi:hypothetical protein